MGSFTPFTYNAHLGYIKNWSGFIDRMRRLKPTYLLAYIDTDSQQDRIFELQRALPETKIIARVKDEANRDVWPDGGYHAPGSNDGYKISPRMFLDRWGHLGQNGLTLYVLNEPNGYGDLKQLAKWTCEIIDLANERGVSLCVLNFGTGHPADKDDMWHEDLDPVLRKLSGSKLHFLGLHEYLPGEGWRVGRLWQMVRRCEKIEVAVPRILITEFGVDATHGETNGPNGYKSRGWSAEYYWNTLFQMYQSWYRELVEAGLLLAICVFCYGNSGGWEAFDTENDGVFNGLMIDNAPRPVAGLPPVESYPTPPENEGTPVTVKSKDGKTPIRFRLEPKFVDNTQSYILNPVDGFAFPQVDAVKASDGSKTYNMRLFLINGKHGWAAEELLTVTPREIDSTVPVRTSKISALKNRVGVIQGAISEVAIEVEDLATLIANLDKSA